MTASTPAHVQVIARAGSAADTIVVHVESPLTVPIGFNMDSDTLEVAPGARYSIGAVTRGDQLEPVTRGRWSSSEPAVATVSPYTGGRYGVDMTGLVSRVSAYRHRVMCSGGTTWARGSIDG